MSGHNVNVSIGDTTEVGTGGTCLVWGLFAIFILVGLSLGFFFSPNKQVIIPTPSPTSPPPPTLDPFAHVIIVQAEANAASQGVDDTIRLEEARTNNQVTLMTVDHEQSLESWSQLAWFGLPYSIIGLGGFLVAVILLIRFTNQ